MAVIYNYQFVQEKLYDELKKCEKSKDRKVRVIAQPVATKLIKFSLDKDFGLTIQKSDKTLLDCCTSILEDVGPSISDIEVYKRAVKFYFPEADIEFSMNIKVPGNKNRSDQKINITFDELF